MSNIGKQIESGSEGPEWVERASNQALRQEIDRLRAELETCRRDFGARVVEVARERDEAREAARWLFDWLLDSAPIRNTEVVNDLYKIWPWLEECE